MGKDKKKSSKKNNLSTGLLEIATTALKEYRRLTKQVSKLSTAQKVVGAVAVLTGGVVYLVNKQTTPRVSFLLNSWFPKPAAKDKG